MIPRAQVEQMIAEAVAKAVADALAEARRQFDASILDARRMIAHLQHRLFGTKAETSRVLFTHEHQAWINPSWGAVHDVTPAKDQQASQNDQAAGAAEAPAKPVRTPRDPRGLAQRYPQLPIKDEDAQLPPELQEQVAAGALEVRRSGKVELQLVAPEGELYLRRIHELEVVKKDSAQPLLQVMPDRIVPGGDLADETIHQVMTGKFLDAIPFHRQLAQLQRHGVDIPKQTINDAANAWGDLFTPMSSAILAQVLATPVVHADASWLHVQAPTTCERHHLWTVVGGQQACYRITKDQKHERAREIIPASFANRLMTDAWAGWFKLDLGTRLGLCNAHARRPFASWFKREPNNADAARIIALYREVYRLEHEADDGPPEQLLDRRRQIRHERIRPVMEQIRTDAQRIVATIHAKHPLADGSQYILDYWEGLTRFLDDPLMPLDNNAAENALRINALIRKNSMFCGSADAADRDAVALTVLHSCRLQKLNPARYLAQVTPVLLLHRRGRPQDLSRWTPAALAAAGQATASP